MLRLLLDEHVPPAVVVDLAKRRRELAVAALRDWRGGALLSADDATILSAAHVEGLTLVTYDLRTIPPLLKTWTEQGVPHGGVVFVHRLTLRLGDVGGLARALARLWDAERDRDWTDRVVFLRR